MGVDSDEIEELFDEIDADGSGEVTIGVYLTQGDRKAGMPDSRKARSRLYRR